ncbi:MAG TPA: heavy metal-binding domain-containing protein, partial [Anaeromyxobacteraceae bacterium]|nr:heavy metal-binding domain-containing protein [Anaeromyxobacteraceae bacterium]
MDDQPGIRTPSPSRRFGAAALAVALAGGLAVGAGGFYALSRGHDHGAATAGGGAEAKKPLYQCPMHPSITSDHPGDCPICGMKLVEVKGGAGERKIAFYRSPMDPKQTSPVPRKDEMGMDYLPVYEDETHGGGAA